MEEDLSVQLEAPPVLSTPDTHILEETIPPPSFHASAPLSDEQLAVVYEIDRTLQEIKAGRWRRVALQFPDEMLPDAPRVYQALSRGITKTPTPPPSGPSALSVQSVTECVSEVELDTEPSDTCFFILGDTSFGACCVDEVAAEHVDADAVVHYGRSCLSPTARLPVIYVFTQRPLELDAVLKTFKEAYPDKNTKIAIAADVLFTSHVPGLYEKLKDEGYANLFATSVIHDPSSPIPNRTVPEEVSQDASALQNWHIFHLSEPPASLLLTLSSRTASISIYPTQGPVGTNPGSLLRSTAASLRRRYALLTSLNTVSVFGILINTLSVKNYLHMVEHVQTQIAAAGKKSYMFVVGKLNAAKVANFSEIGGWVVIGCWESSLVDSKDFWKPIITPFELDLVLKGDGERIWTGEWDGDFQKVLERPVSTKPKEQTTSNGGSNHDASAKDEDEDAESSESESAPPEFDLRTGRYVSHTRPMQTPRAAESETGVQSAALVKRARGDLAVIGDSVSPGAEFLRSKRTWKGLGSDFEVRYDDGESAGAVVEEGRTGMARGYTVGESETKR